MLKTTHFKHLQPTFISTSHKFPQLFTNLFVLLPLGGGMATVCMNYYLTRLDAKTYEDQLVLYYTTPCSPICASAPFQMCVLESRLFSQDCETLYHCGNQQRFKTPLPLKLHLSVSPSY